MSENKFMNLYEFEGKQLFEKHGISAPRGIIIHPKDHNRDEALQRFYNAVGHTNVVVKAQILSGKRGKNNGIRFCGTADEVSSAVNEMFNSTVRNQYVAAALVEEKLLIAKEHYLSITYDTNTKTSLLIYSRQGGMEIEDVSEDDIAKVHLDIRNDNVLAACCDAADVIANEVGKLASLQVSKPNGRSDLQTIKLANLQTPLKNIPYAQELWNCFLREDCRLVEINPLVKTADGKWVAVDAKVAIDGDAFYRHDEWKELEPRTEIGRPPTEREIAVKKIDEGEGYYRGTAGKYIEMDGNIAILFSGGGASIANMDALIKAGLKPANYTEYSGNPPREKVYELTKIVLSKPNLRGLWIAGGVANFTDVAETFHGIVDALDEIKPKYPIVVRRAGPNEAEGMRLMRECAERNGLQMKLYGKETSMSETAKVLAEMVENQLKFAMNAY